MKNFGPKKTLGPNCFGSYKFGPNKMLVQKFVDSQKIGSKKLVEFGSDIADKDKWCMDKCHRHKPLWHWDSVGPTPSNAYNL